MQTEIEAKFLQVDHDEIREKLKALGATLEQPMRLMRRVMLDHADNRYQRLYKTDHKKRERLRIRDEGGKVTVTYKASSDTQYSHEAEIEVSSFDGTVKLFEAVGFHVYSYQESRREAWHYKNVEIVLDVWPWLDPYIEIEGPDEESIKMVAAEMGFDWGSAEFGSVDTAYMRQYKKMTNRESIGDIDEVRFSDPLPDFLRDRI